jgi:DNA-binding beta-propeller fold protein YncE/predicted Ser/Thr protein kinase
MPRQVQIPAALLQHPRYRIERLLGTGGMGAVYRAEHRIMQRTVALKVISPELTDNPAAVERFQREVRAAARLSHPNIVTAHDAEQAGELHFLVMEFVEGTDLAELVARRGPLPVMHACNYIRQAALGLQHAFAAGMVHRDIKPQNLMLTPQGRIKILDFGLARFAMEKSGGSALTQANAMMGTPDYIAPEQANDARSADIRADVYSLGCTLYHLLTGRPPFAEFPLLQKLVAHLEQTPSPVSGFRADVPQEVQGILQRMLAKRPEDRYQTPADVAQELTPFARSGGTAAGPATRMPQPPLILVPANDGQTEANIVTRLPEQPGLTLGPTAVPPRHSSRWTVAAFGIVLLAGLGLLAFAGYRHFTSRGDARREEGDRQILDGKDAAPREQAPELGPPPILGENRRFLAHREEVWAVAFSPDGKSALSAGGARWIEAWQKSNDPTAHLWDVGSGKQVRTLKGHEGGIFGIAFTPDGKRALTASHDGTVRLWELSTGTELKRFRGHEGPLWGLAVSPDGGWAVSGGEDGTVRTWGLPNGTKQFVLRGHEGRVHSVAVSRDGRLILSGGVDKTVRVWDAVTGGQVLTFRGHTAAVRAVTFSPDGRWALSADNSRIALYWEVDNPRNARRLTGHEKAVLSVAISPTGRRALTASLDGTVRLWDLHDGKEQKRIEPGGAPLCVAVSPDGRYALIGGNDKIVKLWGLPK